MLIIFPGYTQGVSWVNEGCFNGLKGVPTVFHWYTIYKAILIILPVYFMGVSFVSQGYFVGVL